MVKNISKLTIILVLAFLLIQIMGAKSLTVLTVEGSYTLETKFILLSITVFFILFRLFFWGLRKLIYLLHNDVLISNHTFEEEKETLGTLRSEAESKIVLTRDQFDEAAILIVQTMTAIKGGLMNDARRQLVNLRKIIGNDAIIDILMLKIYKGEKNFDKMEELSQKLMKNENIQLVGMKASIEAQIEKKEFTEALKTVNQAFEVRQDLYWVIASAFLLRAKNNDWLGALEVLDAGIEKNITPQTKAMRLKAVALYELALQAKEEKDKTKFLKFITQALQENNRLVPAALDLAAYYVENDKQIRKAEAVLYAIWCENPTYEIAQAYLALYPKDSKAEKIQRMEHLALANNKRTSLNNLILAELYVNAKKTAKAKSECNLFLLKNPATQKIAELLDKLEDKTAKTHKNKASIVDSIKSHLSNLGKPENEYPKDFQWMCANCGHSSDKWEAICPECGEIGRSYWHLYIDKSTNTIDEL